MEFIADPHSPFWEIVRTLILPAATGTGGAYYMKRRMIRNGKPSPGNPNGGLTPQLREAIYKTRDLLGNIDDTLCKKDDLGTPLIFKLPNENNKLLRRLLKAAKKRWGDDIDD